MRDIKMIIQKNDLQISSIRRIKFGPYTVGTLKPGQISETDFSEGLKMIYFKHQKKQIKQQQADLSRKLEMIVGEQPKRFDVVIANEKLLKSQ